MPNRRPPKRVNRAKSGVKPGEGAPPPASQSDAGKRPVQEEDVYGGVERTRNPRPLSKRAKP